MSVKPPVNREKKKTRQTEIIPSEDCECIEFVNWLKDKQLEGKVIDFCHIPNESYGGGAKNIIRGKRLKDLGRKKGVFDYQIFVRSENPSGGIINGLMICVELKKRKGGTTSKEQKQWLKVYECCGIPADICKGANEAIEFVERFI